MDFRDYAAKETSDLAARLTKAAAAAADQAARHVADEAQKVADALRKQLQTAVDEKTAAAASLKDAQAQVDRLRGEVKSAAERFDGATRQLEEARKAAAKLEASHAEVTAARDQQAKARQAAEADVKKAREVADGVRGELKSVTARFDAASRQLDEARRTLEAVEAARAELTVAHDEQVTARRAAEGDLRKTRETVESLRGDLASAMKTLEKAAAERLSSEEHAAAAISQSQAAEVKLSAVTDLLKKNAAKVKTLEQAQLESERKIEDLESKLHAARTATPPAPAAPAASAPASTAVLEDLLAGFQALATAGTIAEVLATLVEQMAAQFPRVALFRVKKGHLQGEHQIGFDLQTDIGKLVLPLGMDSLPSRAATSGQIETLTGASLKDSRTPFSGTPSCALALPVVVAGETLAIVYADDSGAKKSARGPGADAVHAQYAGAMQQYAVAVLMRLNNELKALAELRKYAVSLLNEIEQMYNADVEAGTDGEEMQRRLAGNLDYARSIYGSRTALESADAGTLVEDELAALIEARAGSPFARDLAAAAGVPPARSAAEAS